MDWTLVGEDFFTPSGVVVFLVQAWSVGVALGVIAIVLMAFTRGRHRG